MLARQICWYWSQLYQEVLMSQRLVSLATEASEMPTVEQLDAMLSELAEMSRDQARMALIDDLLDFRAMVAE